jgi:hypothetical protein
VGDAGNPYLWDTRTGTRIAGPPKQHWSWSNVVAISPDGRLLASGTLQGFAHPDDLNHHSDRPQ